jgi:uncharacterized protein (DUF58 family)
VVREILFHEPHRRGTDLASALQFLVRVTAHRAIVVVISDFLGPSPFPAIRQANRRHDVVAVRITDRFERDLPPLGRLILKDAETGEVVEVNSANARNRAAFAERQRRQEEDLIRQFRSSRIDTIQLLTDEPYAGALGRFFEAREKRRRHA